MATPPDPSDETRPGARRRGGAPLVVLGGLAALVLGGGVAWVLVSGDRNETPPPAAQGGLVIEAGDNDNGRIDAGRPLRCFVQGQFVGDLTLTECATRNGVATDALDVGLDASGALAAADQAGQALTPLPPVEGEALPPEEEAPPETEPPPGAIMTEAESVCLRHRGGRWRRVGDMDLDSCVQALFAGRCERPGGASYGRYGSQTLRAVAGRIEVSDDNRNFRLLAPQDPDCSVPPVG